jgi:hypothetical protein
VWPFDTASDNGPVAVELWPRLAAPGVIKRRPEARSAWLQARSAHITAGVLAAAQRSEDAFDAVAAALHLAAGGVHQHPRLTDPVAAREGWISGVAAPVASTTKPG